MAPRLTDEFDAALTYAADLHRTQTRKGGEVPYLGHLLSVAGLVIEAGGTQTQAIAALLHDGPEDQGGQRTLAEIRDKFGPDVAEIVAQCSDTFESPKPPWRERKERYIAHLDEASDATILVSIADKLDNARGLLRDYREIGPKLWERFSTQDPQDHLWYYRSLLGKYEGRAPQWLVDELRRVLDALEELIAKDA
jgi:(p)ppGpp synthase/HD superfamily hydrolase